MKFIIFSEWNGKCRGLSLSLFVISDLKCVVINIFGLVSESSIKFDQIILIIFFHWWWCLHWTPKTCGHRHYGWVMSIQSNDVFFVLFSATNDLHLHRLRCVGEASSSIELWTFKYIYHMISMHWWPIEVKIHASALYWARARTILCVFFG